MLPPRGTGFSEWKCDGLIHAMGHLEHFTSDSCAEHMNFNRGQSALEFAQGRKRMNRVPEKSEIHDEDTPATLQFATESSQVLDATLHCDSLPQRRDDDKLVRWNCST